MKMFRKNPHILMSLGLLLASLPAAAMAQDRDVQERQRERAEKAYRQALRLLQERPNRGGDQEFRVFPVPPAQGEYRLQVPDIQRFFGPITGEPEGAIADHGLGLTLAPVEEVLRAQLKLPEDQGLVVRNVAEGSPAAEVIEKNDILLSVDDRPMKTVEDFADAQASAEGEPISVTLLRGGEEKTVEVPTAVPTEAEEPRYYIGISISELNEAVRSQLGLPEDQGVAILDVVENSPADQAGLQPNDILLEIDGQPVRNVDGLVETVQTIGEKTVELSLLRDGERQTVEITPAERPGDLPAPSATPRPTEEPRNLRFFGPGVMIDPETGRVLPRRPGHPGEEPTFTLPAPPEMRDVEKQLGEILQQLEQLRQEVDALKKESPDER